MPSHKEHLRAQLKEARRAISLAQAAALSEQAVQRALAAISWQNVQTVHMYTPLSTYREVDTTTFINFLQLHHPHVRIASWRKADGQYNAHWLDSGELVAPRFAFDVIVVPLLGFNTDCQRIGFGGGFYDRFLAQQAQSTAIGLCYETGLITFTPEAHDIPLDCIATDKHVYRRTV